MEVKTTKQPYDAPTVTVVEIKTEGCVLQTSIPDYIPEEW